MWRRDGRDRVGIEQVPDRVRIDSNRIFQSCARTRSIAVDLKRAQGLGVRPRRLNIAVIVMNQAVGLFVSMLLEQSGQEEIPGALVVVRVQSKQLPEMIERLLSLTEFELGLRQRNARIYGRVSRCSQNSP